jgi:hypothetical protein
MPQPPEVTLADRVAILEKLIPFAMAGRIPHAAEINLLLPADDPKIPSTIANRALIDRLIRRARELRE